MNSLPKQVDCLIVGGGPAGSALAGLLALRGHLVMLVHDGRNRHAVPLETILPAALPALFRCGLQSIVRAATEVDQRRHGARWSSAEWVWQAIERPGLCLWRNTFDAAMRDWALRQGALFVMATVQDLLPTDPSAPIFLQNSTSVMPVCARMVALATGRRGAGRLVPIQTLAQGVDTATFALRFEAPESAQKLAVVEAAASGWSWWIGHDNGGSAVVTVDVNDLHRRGRAVLLREVLDAASGPIAEARNVRLIGAVRATARVQTTTAKVLLLGDAAATLDPLASQGTEKALVSAEAAACAIDFALRTPTLKSQALAHHAQWEHDLWQAHARSTVEFHARVLRFADEPFWAMRRTTAEPERAGPLPARLVRAPELIHTTALRRVVDQLIPEPAVCLPASAPLHRLGRVAVAPILAAFAAPSDVTTAIAIAGQDPALFICGSAAVRMAVHELWQRGFLRAP